MQTYKPSIFARNDTLLGVCQALGEDLGFNPNYLRVALATTVFFSLAAAVAVYLALGAVVLATRLIHRSPRKPMPQQEGHEARDEQAPTADTVLALAPATVRHDEATILMAAAA
jgi:phage shock protein PspC (stress-responsive transcriptional regulator)